VARRVFYLSCTLTAVYSAWILFFHVTPEAESAVSSILTIFLLLLSIILGVFILRLADFPVILRRTWILIILANASQLVAECIWFHDQIILGIDTFPSSADFFYFFYTGAPASRSQQPLDIGSGRCFHLPVSRLAHPGSTILILQRDVERVSREVILFLSISMLFTLVADFGWLFSESYLLEYSQALLDWLWTIAALAMLLAAYWQ